MPTFFKGRITMKKGGSRNFLLRSNIKDARKRILSRNPSVKNLNMQRISKANAKRLSIAAHNKDRIFKDIQKSSGRMMILRRNIKRRK